MTQTANAARTDGPEDQVLTTSKAWIAAFNRGDVEACVAAYEDGAVMVASPLGTFTGRQAIDDFWRPFLGDGAGDLQYDNVKLESLDADTILLAADWRMNVGRGVITKEKWVRQPDGRWLLAEDHFEIQERF